MAPTLSGGQPTKRSGPGLSTRNSDFSAAVNTNGIDGGAQQTKPFGSTLAGANGWNGPSIWGNNNTLTSSLASRERSTTREHPSLLSNGAEHIEGRTGSRALLSSSETDTAWLNRKPWPESNGISSTRTGLSPARQRTSHNDQPFMDNSQSSQLLPHNRSGNLGRNAFRSSSVQLESINHGYMNKDDGGLEVSSEVDRVLGYSNNERSKSVWSRFPESNAVQSPTATDDRRSVTNSEYFGSNSDSLPPSRNGETSGHQGFFGIGHNQGTPGRAQSNATSSAQFLRNTQSRTNSFPNETSAAFDRLSLQSTLLNNNASTHRPSVSNVSMSAYSEQMSNGQRNLHTRANLAEHDQAFEHNNIPMLQSFTPEGLSTNNFTDGYTMATPSHFERGSATPGSSDHRPSPFYSATATPPLPNSSLYTQSTMHARNVSNPAHLDQRLRNIAQQEQQNYGNPQFSLYAPPRFPNGNPLGQHQYQIPGMYPYAGLPQQLPMHQMGFPPLEPPRGPREQDTAYGVRSTVLEEFKSNNKARRWELKDIMEHVVEFAGDQHGSRFIQSKLETANSDEKEAVYRQLQDNALQLMQDVFGNYVIQKFFEHGDQTQKELLAKRMKRKVFDLSKQMYGCRVVQKALEHVLVDQQASLVKELEPAGLVMILVKDQNGNHVIQKAIECVPAEHIQFIYATFQGQVDTLAQHTYGCRVIQRMLENSEGPERTWMMQELHACAANLITDQYGNYVTQHIIEHGHLEDRNHVIGLVIANLLRNSTHKFASNVVEKCLIHGTEDQKRVIMRKILEKQSNGSSKDTTLQYMMNDQYGNYVIQKMQDHLGRADYETLCEALQPEIARVERSGRGGKQLQAIKKRMHRFDSASEATTTGASPTQSRPYSSQQSAAATPPPLSTDAQSLRSDSIPSTTMSAVDEPLAGMMGGLDKTNGVVVPQIGITETSD